MNKHPHAGLHFLHNKLRNPIWRPWSRAIQQGRSPDEAYVQDHTCIVRWIFHRQALPVRQRGSCRVLSVVFGALLWPLCGRQNLYLGVLNIFGRSPPQFHWASTITAVCGSPSPANSASTFTFKTLSASHSSKCNSVSQIVELRGYLLEGVDLSRAAHQVILQDI